MLRTFVAASLLASAISGQIPHGHALVAWKPSNPTATGGFRLVDPAGVNQPITGLAAATVGTTRWDGAQAVAVLGNGDVVAGLGVDNRSGSAAVPLELRRIHIQGTSATADLPQATLMQVPVGEIWKVSDIEERSDGALLVAATQVLTTSNPMPLTAAFLVAGSTVLPLPLGGAPFGSLSAIADAGDRFVIALLQSAVIVNVDLWSMPYAATGTPYRICTFIQTAAVGGLRVDVDSTIVVGVKFQGGALARVPHAPGATPTPVSATPTSVAVSEIQPASGLAAVFAQPSLIAGALHLVDCNAGTATQWAATVVRDPVDVALRPNPAVYGPAVAPNGTWLGTKGGWPALGNAAHTLRLGGKPGALGAVFASGKRGQFSLPFGTLLLDPALLVLVGSAAIPASGQTTLALPIPNNAGLLGLALPMQLAAVEAAQNTLRLSRGLELVVQ